MPAEARLSSPARLSGLLAMLALGLALLPLGHALPLRHWLGAAIHPASGNTAELLFHFSTLPRLVTAFLCGAGLALAGVLAQQVLDNPLAAPSTLGISAGAELALVAATLWMPGLLGGAGREAVAVAGALAAAALVVAIAVRHGFAPLTVILGGLAVGLLASALAAAAKLFDQEEVGALYLWGAGSLSGTDWATVRHLLPRLAALAAGTALLARPLDAFGLGEARARALGVAVMPVRFAAVGLALLLASTVTATVGVIGFVEIAAPALARLAGARRFAARALHAGLIGGFLLMLVDAASRWVADAWGLQIPTGALAALAGGPFLLVMVGRLRTSSLARIPEGRTGPSRRAVAASSLARQRIALLVFGLVDALLLSCLVGRTGSGWANLGDGTGLATVAAWRLPRSLAALGAGALLGGAGALLQRLTGNALAGPETLGLGAGATAGFAAALLISAAPGETMLLSSGTLGAALVLTVLLGTALRHRFSPERLLLTGVALGAVLQALLSVVLALGDARATRLLAWLSGSTYGASAVQAATALGAAAVLCPLALLLGRVLDLLPLGAAVARGLGLRLAPARGLVALLAALMTGAAVETVGPLTFVGLIGPHLAARLGFRRGAAHAAGSALAGALVMVLADLGGRIVAAPFEVPAGIVAAALGIPVFLVLLLRRTP